MLAATLEDMPPIVVKRMVEKFGKRQAVAVLVDRLRASPLGSLPEPLLRELATGLVDSVMNDKWQAA
jgi:hypothetical protein